MNAVKDPFEILADEITLIRRDIERLQRTSLDKTEAKALHAIVVKSADKMQALAPDLTRVIDHRLQLATRETHLAALEAAVSASRDAIEKTHAESLEAARSLSRAAGEARREAWRWFGGFWVWLASVGALGAVLGLLAAFWITGRGDAREFGKYPGVYCTAAGGEIVPGAKGRRFCGIWIDPPKEAGK